MRSRSNPRPFAVARAASLAVCALLLVLTILPTAAVGSELREDSSGAHAASFSSTPIGFSLVGLNRSGFTISYQFAVAMNLTGGPVVRGQHLNASVNLSAPLSANLTLSYQGIPVVFPVNPLGLLSSFKIPGLTYGYEGIATLSLYLNFSGDILANTTHQGPANVPGTPLVWNRSTSYEVPVSIWSNATNGSVVQWSVDDIAYNLSLGIDASGTVFGHAVTLPLLGYGSLGLFPGSPSSASASYTLPGQSGGGGGNGSHGGGPWFPSTNEEYLGLAVLGLIVLVIIAAAVHYRRKPKGPAVPPPTARR